MPGCSIAILYKLSDPVEPLFRSQAYLAGTTLYSVADCNGRTNIPHSMGWVQENETILIHGSLLPRKISVR